MNRFAASFTLAAFSMGAGFSQTTDNSPQFLAADIHKAGRTNPPVMRGPFYGDNRYELRYATMAEILHVAYDVDAERISGGPSWLEMDHFDIIAKTPPGSNAESRRLMLRALLADRFHLKVHNAEMPLAAFALTPGKHAGLKESDGEGESGCKFEVQNNNPPGPPAPGAPQTIHLPVLTYTCRNVTMTAFASALAGAPAVGQYLNNKPIVDRTGLSGAWDLAIRYTPKIPAGMNVTGDNIPIQDAVDKQLGLKLEAANVPVPMVVVESADRQPTPNPADTAELLPPDPEEFEVAEVKVSPPQSGPRPGNLQPEIKNGRLYIPSVTMGNLIQIVWDMNGDEFLIGAPKWFSEDKFDIIAKAPAGVALGDLSANSRGAFSVNIDALRPMLKALITTRFKMQSHMEERQLNAYVLTALKPKLAKADPNERTKWHEGAATEAKTGKNSGALGREVTCQNVTMAEFAEMLPGIAPGYLRTQVVDKTGLEGGWDFTFRFSPIGALNSTNRGGDSGEASDPTGAISLFDAMSKQLGLKLDTVKRATPVLAIDHIERTPVEN